MNELFYWIGLIFVFTSYLSITLGVVVEIRQFGWTNLDWPTIVIALIFAPITIFYMAITRIVDIGVCDDWM